MGHLHGVFDTDLHFLIDPITRTITNQATAKTKLIQRDHNSERFTFEIPRFVESHDMSLCDKVEVHYINIAANKTDKIEDVYIVDDLTVDDWAEDKIRFSWLISGNATQYAGSLNFLIRFVCLTGETIDYAWHTAIFVGISVENGMNNGEAVIVEYSDVLEAWKNEVLAETGEVARTLKQRDITTLTRETFNLRDVGDNGKVKLKAQVTDSSLESFEVWAYNTAVYDGGYETGIEDQYLLYKRTKEFIPITANSIISFRYACPYFYTRILCYDADYNQLAYVTVGEGLWDETYESKDARDLLAVAPNTKYIKIVSVSEDGIGTPVLYDVKIMDNVYITLTRAENFEKEAEILYPVCQVQGEDAVNDYPTKIELTYTRDVYAYIDYLESRIATLEAAVLNG